MSVVFTLILLTMLLTLLTHLFNHFVSFVLPLSSGPSLDILVKCVSELGSLEFLSL